MLGFSILIVILIISLGTWKSYNQSNRKKCIVLGKSVMISSYFITSIIGELFIIYSRSSQPGWDATVISLFVFPLILLIGLGIFLIGKNGGFKEA